MTIEYGSSAADAHTHDDVGHGPDAKQYHVNAGFGPGGPLMTVAALGHGGEETRERRRRPGPHNQRLNTPPQQSVSILGIGPEAK